MTSFTAIHDCLCKTVGEKWRAIDLSVHIYKKKITRWVEDINFMFSCLKQYLLATRK